MQKLTRGFELGVFFLLSCAVAAEELALPTVIIEGRELMRIRPGERVLDGYDHPGKIKMPERLRRKKESKYLLLEVGGGSENTVTFGCLGRYKRERFAVDIEANFMSTEGLRDGDDENISNQETSLYLETDGGSSLRVDLKCAERYFGLPGPDWNPFVEIERESALKSAAVSLSAEVLSETSLNIKIEAEESVIDDNNDGSDIYTRTGAEVSGEYGKVGFGCGFWKHDLDESYTADEVRAFVSLDGVEFGERVTVGLRLRVQDYGTNGALVDPELGIVADLYKDIVWRAVLSREMVVRDFDENYGTSDYTKVNRLELKPERNWRLETSLSKTFVERLKVKLYGFGEDWRNPAVWDLVEEPVAARGFYTLRQIEGYTVVGGGLRIELEIGEGVRIFLDTVLRDCEKDDSVAGSIPFVPRVESEFGAEFRVKRFTLLLDAVYRAEQYYDMESRDAMEEMVGLGGILEYATGNVTVYLEGRNLAREDYLKVQGYPSAEASWILGMRIFF